ncbi:hypothetical protein PBY51_007165 [Eleginops maclovinus]|uniref:Uncharacterized protein n=1 Tax=Eleginops maclovinus TaxID=56733 RepID=A0AAN7X5P4_ELEMC|nr:hypothetical protein PBY51_007165 [Eleginops maclovinus]
MAGHFDKACRGIRIFPHTSAVDKGLPHAFLSQRRVYAAAGHMSDQRHSGSAPEPPVSPDCRLVDGKQSQQVGTRQSTDKRSFV